jgi:galactose mutarotase-like enzyme
VGALINLENRAIEVSINETLGAELVKIGNGKTNYLANYDWLAPIGSKKSETYGDQILDWLSDYRGGWQVLFPNAGNATSHLGVPLPFHGEFARSNMDILEQTKTKLVVRSAARIPLILTRTFELLPNSAVLKITQVVTNESDMELPFIGGEHPAFSLPGGSKIKMPIGPITADLTPAGATQDVKVGAEGIWPNIVGNENQQIDLSVVPSSGAERLCYLYDRPDGWVAMTYNEKIIGLAWDIEAYPHLWMWQQIKGSGFPFFGRAKITAIEPASTWPSYGLTTAIESGQAFWIKPGETKSAWTTFSVSSLPASEIENIKSIDASGNFLKLN